MVIAPVNGSCFPVVRVYFIEHLSSNKYKNFEVACDLHLQLCNQTDTKLSGIIPQPSSTYQLLISRAGLFKRQCVAMTV